MKSWHIVAVITLTTIAGGGFYLLYWRKRKGVSSTDAEKIEQVKVVLDVKANDTSDAPIFEQE